VPECAFCNERIGEIARAGGPKRIAPADTARRPGKRAAHAIGEAAVLEPPE
jgi:hypothetical protein